MLTPLIWQLLYKPDFGLCKPQTTAWFFLNSSRQKVCKGLENSAYNLGKQKKNQKYENISYFIANSEDLTPICGYHSGGRRHWRWRVCLYIHANLIWYWGISGHLALPRGCWSCRGFHPKLPICLGFSFTVHWFEHQTYIRNNSQPYMW